MEWEMQQKMINPFVIAKTFDSRFWINRLLMEILSQAATQPKVASTIFRSNFWLRHLFLFRTTFISTNVSAFCVGPFCIFTVAYKMVVNLQNETPNWGCCTMLYQLLLINWFWAWILLGAMLFCLSFWFVIWVVQLQIWNLTGMQQY